MFVFFIFERIFQYSGIYYNKTPIDTSLKLILLKETWFQIKSYSMPYHESPWNNWKIASTCEKYIFFIMTRFLKKEIIFTYYYVKGTISEFPVFRSVIFTEPDWLLASELHSLPTIPAEIIRKHMKSFATIFNGFQPLTTVTKLSIGFLMSLKGIGVARKCLKLACFCKNYWPKHCRKFINFYGIPDEKRLCPVESFHIFDFLPNK